MSPSTIESNRVAVAGMIAVGVVVAFSSFTIVRAEHVQPATRKTFKCTSGTACVEGSSTGSGTWGVYGTAVSADGLHGVTNSTNGNSGTSGISTGTSGSAHGVYGRSSNGQGVYGTSSSNNGVEGHSSASGGSGVAGIETGKSSESGVGVYSESADTTNSYEALEAKADSSNTYIFEGYNAVTEALCTIDYNATLACTGGAIVKSVRTRHTNANGQHVLAYAAESATATIEDVGTARLIAGVANVAIDPAFGAVMDHRWYYVFLTPLGETRGLYVSSKAASSFQVRESEGGRSRVEFDYRIVAHPFDAKNDRLPLARALRMPRDGMRPN
ncbi:MAG TPA: hypothetical protein VFE16_11095 [Candidatus Cybelea sp.]|jgi:hypothetical protein|nr:hypothetical protein [Candidatus Cybelea sp.]